MTGYWQLICVLGFYCGTSAAKPCSSPGKFPNDIVGSCDGYTICLMAGAGNYAQYNLSCPPGFIYNHNQSQCTNDTSYQCVPEFNCTEVGLYPNPFDNNCTSFIICVEGLNDIMTARSIMCPPNTIYSPIEKTCTNESIFKCYRKLETLDFNDISSDDDDFSLMDILELTDSSHCLLTNQFVLFYLLFIILALN